MTELEKQIAELREITDQDPEEFKDNPLVLKSVWDKRFVAKKALKIIESLQAENLRLKENCSNKYKMIVKLEEDNHSLSLDLIKQDAENKSQESLIFDLRKVIELQSLDKEELQSKLEIAESLMNNDIEAQYLERLNTKETKGESNDK